MKRIDIDSVSDPRISMFVSMTEKQLADKRNSDHGIFIVESPKVIKIALERGYHPVALMCEEKHIYGDAKEIIAMAGEIPVFTGPREILASITGYTLTRGVLCAMRRPTLPSPAEICGNSCRICIIDGVTDTTNIGSIFRSAAALGFDAVMLTPTSCDPLNRRSVRVSMGSVFLIPWTWIDSPQHLHQFGFKTAAMALRDDSISIDNPILKTCDKLALIMGTEGDGLSDKVIAQADYVVRIPMFHNVDSLNVAAAATLAFWELRPIQ